MKLTLLSLGSQLRDLRQKSRMTQAQLAKLSGVSRGWLNEVENGKVNVEFGLLLDVFSTLGYVIEVNRDDKSNKLDLSAEHLKNKESENVWMS
ncbi:MAG TPA: helix-turn-helix domain-containing protein [Candidatus Paceibacterota bacterium]|nr:helix-turn-helix domain-containing protein [Candidatus Paceibacterota bacterium]